MSTDAVLRTEVQVTEAMDVARVTKTYPGVIALDGVSLRVATGEVHGVVGENGAGKSTLMGVISGSVVPDAGIVRIGEVELPAGDPVASRERGVAIVRQEPALLPDLSVAENLYLGMPKSARPAVIGLNAWARGLLRTWSDDLPLDPRTRVDELPPEHRFIVEITRAIATNPSVLILDEPTEHLAGEDVERLFARIRELTSRGVAVVYISHRIAEVKSIAERLTILRNGRTVGTYDAEGLTESRIVNLIVGRELSHTFPPKDSARLGDGARVVVEDLGGARFRGLSLSAAPGEIVGFAGIEGNGQREALRALAGILPSTGSVRLSGASVSLRGTRRTARQGIAYIASDRHREGIFSGLSIRENVAIRSLKRFARAGFVSDRRERAGALDLAIRFGVRTPSIANTIDSLSGGNQQKAVIAGAIGTEPDLLLLDEPTQGVDVGARSEIYGIIRDRARESGMTVLVHSTDARELAGIADRVLVFSRGKIVAELAGDDVVEEKITGAALSSTETREKSQTGLRPVTRWLAGDVAPSTIVGLATVVLAVVTQIANPYFLGGPSVGSVLSLMATLAVAALAQTLVLLVGGIDLSVGPLMGLLVVIQSFFLVDGTGTGLQLLGWVIWLGVPIVVGLVNWAIIDIVKVHPMIATLVTYTALQAVSLLLRPVAGGVISDNVTSAISARVGPIPIATLVVIVIAIILTFLLFTTRKGIVLRATGSDDAISRLNGINPRLVRLLAYVGASLIAAFGSILLMAQLGSGDPAGGTSYTLASISAAVIGGASLAGGRGAFIGAALGALLIQVANSVTTFLALDSAWQSYLLGGLTIIAVAGYSRSRHLVSSGARA